MLKGQLTQRGLLHSFIVCGHRTAIVICFCCVSLHILVALPFICVCSRQLKNTVSVYVEKLLLSPWLLQNLSVSKCTCPVHATGNHMDSTGTRCPATLEQPLLLKPRHKQFRPPQFWAVVCSLLWWHFKTWFGNTGCVFCNEQPFTCSTLVFMTVLSGSAIFTSQPLRENIKLKLTDYNIVNL